jgi:hypothetical protein
MTKKRDRLAYFKFATVVKRKGEALLTPGLVEMFWAQDDVISFSLQQGCSVFPWDELLLTHSFGEQRVRVMSLKPDNNANRIETRPIGK